MSIMDEKQKNISNTEGKLRFALMLLGMVLLFVCYFTGFHLLISFIKEQIL